ncbi:MAG: M23 family metallopeptidase [Ruthenibacterium sp.]
MDKHAKTQGFWRGKGFYIALALITAGAALACFLAVNAMMTSFGKAAESTPEQISEQEDITWGLSELEIDKNQSSVPVTPSPASNTASSPSVSSASSKPRNEPAALQPVQTPPFVSPVTGETLAAFSGDTLVFNETMQDWRTHNGVDIACAIGSGISAPTAATVSKIETDGQWGDVIELTSDKLTMRLVGAKAVNLVVGDVVKQGAPLGALTAIPAESAIPAHLHFEMSEDGKNVDPVKYFAK